MNKIALVVGASGITGSNLAEKLISQGWTTYGLARNPNVEIQHLIDFQAKNAFAPKTSPPYPVTAWVNQESRKVALQNTARIFPIEKPFNGRNASMVNPRFVVKYGSLIVWRHMNFVCDCLPL